MLLAILFVFIHHSSLPKVLYGFCYHPSKEVGGGFLELTAGVHSLVRWVCCKADLQVKGQDKHRSQFSGR